MKIRSILITLIASATMLTAHSQEPKVKLSAYDGIIIAGYVDEGAFLNFMGPNLNLTIKQSKFCLGMLPSLRFKEDHGTPKNAFVTPNLGAGLTYSYKWFAIQVPCYYNAKTATKNGQWNVGIGVGLRLNGLKK
ncbi:MAG: hypothetical protein QE487_14315 [Fluviicola sp.]|nr:hypothetical protein [Fluviicola sp.]